MPQFRIGSGSAPMTGSGQHWQFTLGPFSQAGSVTLTVSATDVEGDTGSTIPFTIDVFDCPIIG